MSSSPRPKKQPSATDVLLVADPDVLDRHARNPDWVVREAVASNLRTASETLAWLGGDPSSRVREAVASHNKTPLRTLVDLLSESDPSVREAVLSNAVVPAELIVEALRGPAPVPDWALARWVHHTTALPPIEVLERLLTSPDRAAYGIGLRSLGRTL